MEKQLRIGEFLISLVILIGMGTAAWVNVKTTQAQQAVQIENLKEYYQKAAYKQDEILKNINDLRILIENKQDRESRNNMSDNQKRNNDSK